MANVIQYKRLRPNQQTDQVLTQSILPAYENLLQVNSLLGASRNQDIYLDRSFQVSENAKSLSLYHAIQNANALHYSGIPDSLLEKEYRLRVEIAYMDKKKQEHLNQGIAETDIDVLAISSRLFDLNQAKPDYIQQYGGLKAHPGLWAALIAIGEMRSL